ncbi:hypothetical protein ILYODFUR_012763 [Ilyodon furcidens]|uniref:Uncharacterized protein n=1 Tax=Ilyodon furcidens TaxID=33524 RepID=A0ABV0UUI1_9TELE
MRLRHFFGDPSSLSVFSPLGDNDAFSLGKSDGGFKTWAKKGLEKIGNLYNEQNVLKNISSNHFFQIFTAEKFYKNTTSSVIYSYTFNRGKIDGYGLHGKR